MVYAFLLTRSLDFLSDRNILSHFAVSCSVKFLGVADAISPVVRLVQGPLSKNLLSVSLMKCHFTSCTYHEKCPLSTLV